jgi:NAD-dependent dihydropyrimidine dehydrogenase PreA subunit
VSDTQEATPQYQGLMIPVHVEIDAAQVVLAQPEMRELLASADVIATGICGCRRDATVCDHPLDVCLAINEEARNEIEKDGWREISLDEALAVLERSHRAGLVHLAYRKDHAPVTLICSCCPCACFHLKALKGHDYREGITESAYVARYDEAACIGCGACVERCVFGAFRRSDARDSVEFHASTCFGCGLCVSTCPAGAIAFVRR